MFIQELDFSIPDPDFSSPDAHPQNWTEQKLLLRCRKYDPSCWSRIQIFPLPDPGSRYQKSTGSRIRIRNIVFTFQELQDTEHYMWEEEMQRRSQLALLGSQLSHIRDEPTNHILTLDFL